MTANVPDPATEDLGSDQQAVWDAMRAVYAAFLAGDAAAADAHLHPEVTLWDSAEPGLVRGLSGLRELRRRRTATQIPDSNPSIVAIEATDPVIDIWGDLAVLRHLLRVRHGAGGPPDELVRNTSVWRRLDGRWLAVHNHEDVVDM